MGDGKNMETLETICELEGIIEQVIEEGSEMLIINDEFIDANVFFNVLQDKRDEIDCGHYIDDNNYFLKLINGKIYNIEIA